MPDPKKKAPAKKTPAKKKPAAKKKAAAKPKFRLEASGDLGAMAMSFDSESARDAAMARLNQSVGEVPGGLQHCIKDDAGCEFRYMTIKSVSKL